MRYATVIELSRESARSDNWKVFGSGNIPMHDGWIRWTDVVQMAKKLNAQIPANYWDCNGAVMSTIVPQAIEQGEGLRLRTVLDTRLAAHIPNYQDRAKVISGILEEIENRTELGDWLTEDTGRMYTLTFIPNQR